MSVGPKDVPIVANVGKLINVLETSLFTTDSFIREIVSNSIDALDERVNKDPDFKQFQSEIRVYVDRNKEINTNNEVTTLSIVDNGIGMTKDEAVKNLATLFQSSKVQGGSIGMFGIGFYSSLKVADHIEVSTRSAIKPQDGCKIDFDRRELKENCSAKVWDQLPKVVGTHVKLFLDEKFSKTYGNTFKIETILLKYFELSLARIFLGNSPEPIVQEIPLYLQEDIQFITDEQWRKFLRKHLPHGEPITQLPLTEKTKGVLVIPQKSSIEGDPFGIKLYVKHVFIKDCLTELLSEQFRPFVSGIVDVDSLPLRLDRDKEMEESTELNSLKNELDESVVYLLSNCAENKRETFKEIMKYHLPYLKQACNASESLFKGLFPYLHFHTSFMESTSFNDFCRRRSGNNQKNIFYLTNEINFGPFLEIFKKRNIEVLFLENAEEIKLLKQYEEQNPDQQLIRIDQAPPEIGGIPQTLGAEGTLPPNSRVLQEQVRQVFHTYVDAKLSVKLVPLPNINMTSLFWKKKDESQKDANIRDEVKKLVDQQMYYRNSAEKEKMIEALTSHVKCERALRILVLNENNTVVQKLCSILNSNNTNIATDVLLRIAKSLYYLAFIFSEGGLREEQLDEYGELSSKILSEYSSLYIDKLGKQNN